MKGLTLLTIFFLVSYGNAYPPSYQYCKTIVNHRLYQGILTLDCSDKKFSRLPFEPPENADSIEVLILSKNQIRSIRDSAFDDFTKLEYLDLSDNRIEKIDSGAFIGLSDLKWLYLNGNSIKTVGNIAFDEISNLELLNLSKNKLVSFQNRIFSALGKLKRLNLSNNNINCSTYVPWLVRLIKQGYFGPEVTAPVLQVGGNSDGVHCGELNTRDLLKDHKKQASYDQCTRTHVYHIYYSLNCSYRGFSELPKERPMNVDLYIELSFNGNNIKHLHNGRLSAFKKLERLHLKDNKLQIIDRHAFAGLRRLTHLDLTNNRLDHIPDYIFVDMFHLFFLSLAYNDLTHIQANSLGGNIELKFLDLTGNKLENIEIGTINHLNLLRTVNISNQRSREELMLPLGVFKNFVGRPLDNNWPYNIIDLSNNDFLCTCDMLWLINITNKAYFGDRVTIPALQSDKYMNGMTCGLHNMKDKAFVKRFTANCALPKYDDCQDYSRPYGMGLDCSRLGFAAFPHQPPKGAEYYKELLFNGNSIKSLPAGALAPFKGLIKLNFRRNNLEMIGKEAFSNNMKLEHLILSKNRIRSISAGTFLGHSSMKALDLSRNKLESITEDTLAGLTNLESLIVSHNEIKTIDANSFKGNKKISLLDLLGNRLESINETSFWNLTLLNTTILSRQRTKGKLTLPLSLFKNFIGRPLHTGWPRLLIDLSYNNYNCTCDMKWLVNIISFGDLADGRKIPALHEKKLTSEISCNFKNVSNVDFAKKFIMSCDKSSYKDCSVYPNIQRKYTIDCSNKGFMDIPLDVPNNATMYNQLIFSHNFISKISAAALLSFTNLEYLIISHNNITKIPPGMFSPFKKLKQIFLHHNQIKKIETGTFSNLLNIDHLNLDNNLIKEIDKKAFVNFGKLATVTFVSNDISYVTPDAFSGSVSISSLNLNRNGMTDVSPDAFKSIQNLTELRMEHNRLEIILNPHLSSLTQLKSLYLTNNTLLHVSTQTFHQMKQLQNLYLNQNKLASIKGLFKDHSGLVYLDLSNNYLINLEGEFSGLNKLEYLHLGNNRIKNITDQDFLGLDVLDQLHLSNNELEIISAKSITSLKLLRTLDISSQRSVNKLQLPLGILANFVGKYNDGDVSRLVIDISNNNFQCTCDMNWLFYLIHNNILPDGRKIPALQGFSSTWGISCGSEDIRNSSYANLFMKACSLAGSYSWNYCQSFLIKNNKWLLDCEETSLPAIPSHPLTDAYKYTELNLNYNNIDKIPAGILSPFKNLKKLSLAKNQISRIEADTFRGLNNLIELGLRENTLISIHEEAFRDMKGLRNLELARQRSQGKLILPLNLFKIFINKTVDKLLPDVSLDISHNDLKCPCEMKWLVNLVLHDKLPDGSKMPGLNRLNNLLDVKCNSHDISNRSFSSSFLKHCSGVLINFNVAPDYKRCKVYRSFNTKKGLDCSLLGFSEIPRFPPSDADTYSELTFIGNDIKTISSGVLAAFKNVKRLYMQYNRLEEIDIAAFKGMDKLSLIDLSEQMSIGKLSLRKEVFENIVARKSNSYVTAVFLGKNNFKCDCNMYWLIHLINYGKLPDNTDFYPIKFWYTANAKCMKNDIHVKALAQKLAKDCRVSYVGDTCTLD